MTGHCMGLIEAIDNYWQHSVFLNPYILINNNLTVNLLESKLLRWACDPMAGLKDRAELCQGSSPFS